MVKSDTTNRYNGLIQRCEDTCGIGAAGITGNSTLYSQFIGWLNQWNRLFASWAIQSWDGADFDDIGYTTDPHGTITATLNREYNVDESYKMLKLKLMQVTYDGKNWVVATPFDAQDYITSSPTDVTGGGSIATHDPNVDQLFSINTPKYDLRAMGFDLFPKFTQDNLNTIQANAGNLLAIYIEFFRLPRDFDTSSGTDLYEPCLDGQFHHLVALAASYEYCRLYKPDAAADLQGDLYGVYYRGRQIKKGFIDELQEWYNSKSPARYRVTMKRTRKL